VSIDVTSFQVFDRNEGRAMAWARMVFDPVGRLLTPIPGKSWLAREKSIPSQK
jgi:hypothetical protein